MFFSCSIYLYDRIVAFDQPDLAQQRKYEERYKQLLSAIVVDHPFVVSILIRVVLLAQILLLISFEVIAYRKHCFENSKLPSYVNCIINEGIHMYIILRF